VKGLTRRFSVLASAVCAAVAVLAQPLTAQAYAQADPPSLISHIVLPQPIAASALFPLTSPNVVAYAHPGGLAAMYAQLFAAPKGRELHCTASGSKNLEMDCRWHLHP